MRAAGNLPLYFHFPESNLSGKCVFLKKPIGYHLMKFNGLINGLINGCHNSIYDPIKLFSD